MTFKRDVSRILDQAGVPEEEIPEVVNTILSLKFFHDNQIAVAAAREINSMRFLTIINLFGTFTTIMLLCTAFKYLL